LVDLGVGVQPGVVHDPVDEVIDHGGDGVHPAKSFVEGRHLRFLPSPRFLNNCGVARLWASAPSNRYAFSSTTQYSDSFTGPEACGTVISSLAGSPCGCRATTSGTARRHPSISSSSQASGGRSDRPRSLWKPSG